MHAKSLQSYLTFSIQWTIAHQAPLSIEFSRQEYWSGLPFPSPGYLPNPGIKPLSLELQAVSLRKAWRGMLFRQGVLGCRGIWGALVNQEPGRGQGLETSCRMIQLTKPHQKLPASLCTGPSCTHAVCLTAVCLVF